MNIVVLSGTLSRDADRRTLGSGSVLLQLDVTTVLDAVAASVPVAWFDPPATAELTAGEQVVVVGSVRRRFFRAGGSTQSRTEVVARAVVKASQRRQVTKLLGQAAGQLSGEGIGAH